MAKRNKIKAEVEAEIRERAQAVAELRMAKLQEIRGQLVLGIESGSRKPLEAALRLLDQLMHRGPGATTEAAESKDEDEPEEEAKS